MQYRKRCGVNFVARIWKKYYIWEKRMVGCERVSRASFSLAAWKDMSTKQASERARRLQYFTFLAQNSRKISRASYCLSLSSIEALATRLSLSLFPIFLVLSLAMPSSLSQYTHIHIVHRSEIQSAKRCCRGIFQFPRPHTTRAADVWPCVRAPATFLFGRSAKVNFKLALGTFSASASHTCAYV